MNKRHKSSRDIIAKKEKDFLDESKTQVRRAAPKLSASAQALEDLKHVSWRSLLQRGQLVEYVLTHQRWILVIGLLPAQALWMIFILFLERFAFLTRSSKKHAAKVDIVVKQIKSWNEEGRKKLMCTARPGWKVMSLRVGKYKKTHRNIDLSALNEIVEVDETRGVVRVEPLVSMGQLTTLLNSMGWTLPVIPELDDLTVGGLIAGYGVESQSHKSGLFQHICTAFEIVLSSGDIKYCTPTNENKELFYAIPWSYGSIGFLMSAELKLMRAKKYVHLTYHPFHTKRGFVEKFTEESLKENPVDFIEALVYSKNKGVVMTGNMVDDVPSGGNVNHIGYWYKKFFYSHAEQTMVNSKTTTEEYIPLREYYHRHTRGIFWELLDIIPFANSSWFLFLFGWLLPIKVSLLKVTQTETTRRMYEENHVVQDMLVPVSTLSRALSAFDELYDIFPLWLCPMKIPREEMRGMVGPTPDGEEMFVDIGAYGNPNAPSYHHIDTSRAVEDFVREVHGFQGLYADSYHTRGEFRDMFDHTLLDKMRAKYNCLDAFPEPYDKVCKNARL